MMLKLSGSLSNQSVISLHSGAPLAIAKEPVIDPRNLKILGWRCNVRGTEMILLAEDVREAGPNGLMVNDESSLSAPVDLARHQGILEIKFQPIGKLVKNSHEKLGKVSDYAYDDSMMIQQLYVEPPLLKIFGAHDTRIVGRNQIKEVTDAYILVGDTEVDAKEPVKKSANAEAAPLPETA